MIGLHGIQSFLAEAKREENPWQEMLHVVARIGHETDRVFLLMLCNELLQERRLAHSRISGEDHERRLIDKAVFQEAVGGAMRRARIERFAIR